MSRVKNLENLQTQQLFVFFFFGWVLVRACHIEYRRRKSFAGSNRRKYQELRERVKVKKRALKSFLLQDNFEDGQNFRWPLLALGLGPKMPDLTSPQMVFTLQLTQTLSCFMQILSSVSVYVNKVSWDSLKVVMLKLHREREGRCHFPKGFIFLSPKLEMEELWRKK